MDKNYHAEASLITHFVAGYPDMESSLEIAKGLIKGGADILEIQFPFSDPSADGPVIEAACREALKKGFTIEKGFGLLEQIINENDTPVYIMSYGNLVFRMGIENFIKRAKTLGAKGLIIPDLVPGSDEGLYSTGKEQGMPIIPVIVPTVTDNRLEEIMEEKPEWIYTALRSGITGKYTELDESNLDFLNRLVKYPTKVMAGFGIRSAKQIKLLAPHCDGQIVGSYIIEQLNTAIDSSQSLEKTAASTVSNLLSI